MSFQKQRPQSVGATLVIALLACTLPLSTPAAQVRPATPTIKIPGAKPKAGAPTSVDRSGVELSRTIKLSAHPEASQILSEIAGAFHGVEVDVALLANQTYSAGDCAGIKVSSGAFAMQLTPPQFVVDNSGVAFMFTIPHVSFNALKLKVKPSVNIDPCTFGGVVDVGGSASDVRFVYRIDPILALQNCSMVRLNPSWDDANWSIGGLNLKPLQNDLDKAAKKMLVEGLNMMSGASLGKLFAMRVEQVLKLHPKCA